MATQAPALVFWAVLSAGVGLLLATADLLPPTVATGFDAGGRAEDFMQRDSYERLMLLMMLGCPLLVRATTAWLPARLPRLANVPYRHYWLAPERRASSLGFLAGHGLWLAGLAVAYFAGLHGLVLEANSLPAPQLDGDNLLLQTAALLMALLAWILGLRRRFPDPRSITKNA
jgi:hypothetical protein